MATRDRAASRSTAIDSRELSPRMRAICCAISRSISTMDSPAMRAAAMRSCPASIAPPMALSRLSSRLSWKVARRSSVRSSLSKSPCASAIPRPAGPDNASRLACASARACSAAARAAAATLSASAAASISASAAAASAAALILICLITSAACISAAIRWAVASASVTPVSAIASRAVCS